MMDWIGATSDGLKAGGLGLDVRELVAADIPWKVPLSLAVAPGEIVAVLGPPRSGKSALLRAIAGLDPIERGTIRVDGEDVTEQPPEHRRIALVALAPGAIRTRPAHDWHARPSTGASSPNAGIAALLSPSELFEGELDSLLSAVPLALSPLDQLRAALARAVFHRPGALAIDEGLDRLDGDGARMLGLQLVRRLAQAGLPILLATADASLAAVAQRAVVVDTPGPLDSGEPARLRASPASRRSMEIVGGEGVGFLAARVGAGESILTTERGTRLGVGVPGASLWSNQVLSVGLDAHDVILGSPLGAPLRGVVEQVDYPLGTCQSRVLVRCEGAIVSSWVPVGAPPRPGESVGIQSIGIPWLFHGATGTPIGRLVSYGVEDRPHVDRATNRVARSAGVVGA